MFPESNWWPASHQAGSTPGAPPMGTRLRLKAATEISGYPPVLQRIFQAMKTYGVIQLGWNPTPTGVPLGGPSGEGAPAR